MSWEEVLAYVIDQLGNVLGLVVLPWAFAKLLQYVDNTIVSNLVKQAEETAIACVRTIKQTYVDGLKKEGKFDAAAQKAAFDMCMNDIERLLSDAAKQAIVKSTGDFAAWAKIQIESGVEITKSEGASNEAK